MLCSPECVNNCPNIIDLYINLAAGEGKKAESYSFLLLIKVRVMLQQDHVYTTKFAKSKFRKALYPCPTQFLNCYVDTFFCVAFFCFFWQDCIYRNCVRVQGWFPAAQWLIPSSWPKNMLNTCQVYTFHHWEMVELYHPIVSKVNQCATTISSSYRCTYIWSNRQFTTHQYSWITNCSSSTYSFRAMEQITCKQFAAWSSSGFIWYPARIHDHPSSQSLPIHNRSWYLCTISSASGSSDTHFRISARLCSWLWRSAWWQGLNVRKLFHLAYYSIAYHAEAPPTEKELFLIV